MNGDPLIISFFFWFFLQNDSSKCTGSISLARQKFVAVNGGPPQMLPVNKETAMMLKDLDIKALEEECQELKTRLGAIKVPRAVLMIS